MAFAVNDMYRTLTLCIFLTMITACGGSGGGSDEFSLAGMWSGNLRQASGLQCFGGSFIGAGVGTVSDQETTVEIQNGSTIGESGTLTIDGSDCEYIGTRDSTDSMSFTSDDTSCWESIEASEFEEDSIFLTFDPHPPKLLADGTPTCVGLFDGEFTRS